ncbi:3-oxoacyl-ACP reductase-like protein [Sphingomonas zeicaulis]|uniref:DUF3597 domain-containing protein n=1 Tax=Sphingomonas zeicaulis TaxID=1632740 RepID=UPI003D23B742
MSIFGSIVDKIFHSKKAAPAAPRPAQAPPTAAPVPQAPVPAAPPPPAAAPAPVAVSAVDVEAVLNEMAKMKDGGGGNWRTSIVDLLRLLDLETSLAARRELADELGVHAGDHGSAEQNIALHKAVMRKLADNGGIVPESLRD